MNERIDGSLFLYPATDEKVLALVNNTNTKKIHDDVAYTMQSHIF